MDLSFVNHTWWGALLFVVVCGHLTVMCTSVYMHRAMAHQGVKLHPIISWSMRWWLWIFTGMSTREWVAVHRKHHAFCETEEDPHSPVIHGWAQILFFGVKYYRNSYNDPATMERFTKGCPEDWFEYNVFIPHKMIGLVFLFAVDYLIFAGIGFTWMTLLTTALVWTGQVLWVPFWAAGVVNGLGHTIGYRNYKVKDESRNLIPLGILLSGEELHNNHHKYPSSAKFSKRWFELDFGWWYINVFRLFGLAKVKVVQQGLPNFKASMQAAAESAKEAAIERAHAAADGARHAAQSAHAAAIEMAQAPRKPALSTDY